MRIDTGFTFKPLILTSFLFKFALVGQFIKHATDPGSIFFRGIAGKMDMRREP